MHFSAAAPASSAWPTPRPPPLPGTRITTRCNRTAAATQGTHQGRRPEVIEQGQLGFIGRRVCPRTESVPDLVAPAPRLRRIHHQVVAFEVEEAVALGGPAPCALQPAGPAYRPVAQLGLAALRSLVVVTHLLGADAADVEVLIQIRVFHDVDVADLLVAAHLAGRVIGIVRRLAVGPQVDHVHAVPSFVGHARLVPSISAHASSLHLRIPGTSARSAGSALRCRCTRRSPNP